ncbi:hypothetical protein TRFO_14895 [Tritrichomonas foetus]|uniref:Uncharacterized protein n=1 Tax=Tritrichomonas foetus TaxID=1144522 RepID=A0A1J4KUZ9_9EUKA|nr:hypothetical protein TRFO_14895 [Tritrichomonas foetus]|eukprot:OHT14704.1 hypothetical protein TRFO_14895 [Tritrichomonas foetus]
MEINVENTLFSIKWLMLNSNEQEKMMHIQFLNHVVQDEDAYKIFIEIIRTNPNDDSIDYFAYSGLKKWKEIHIENLYSSSNQSIIYTFQEIIFLQKKVSKLIRKLFAEILINHENNYDFIQNILMLCNEYMNDQPEAAMHMISLASKMYSNFSIITDASNLEFLSIIYSYAHLHLDNFKLYLNQSSFMNILKYSIKSIKDQVILSLLKKYEKIEGVSAYIHYLLTFFIHFYSFILGDYQHIYHPNLANDFLSLLQKFSKYVYQIMKVCNSKEESCLSIINEIKNEWQHLTLALIWNVSTLFFKRNVFIYSKDKIGVILLPVYKFIDKFDFTKFNFFEVIDLNDLIKMIELTSDDINESICNPELFYKNNYCIISSHSSNVYGLRNVCLQIFQKMAKMTQLKLHSMSILSNIQINESIFILLTIIIKKIIDNNEVELFIKYIENVLKYFSRQSIIDPTLMSSFLFLLSKSLKNPSLQLFTIETFLKISNETFFLDVNQHPILFASLIHLLLKLTVNGFDFPSSYITLLIDAIQTRITCVNDEIFKLLDLIIGKIQEQNSDLIANFLGIIDPLLVVMKNEIEITKDEEDSFCTINEDTINSVLSIYLKLLDKIIGTECELEIIHVIFDCIDILSSLFNIEDLLFLILQKLISNRSNYSYNIIFQLLSRLNNSSFTGYLLNCSNLVLAYIHSYSKKENENEIDFSEIYHFYINLLKNDLINEEIELYMISKILCFIIQLYPQHVANDASEIVNYFIINDHFDLYYQSAFINLIISYLITNIISFDSSILEMWTKFISSNLFISDSDLRLHFFLIQTFEMKNVDKEIQVIKQSLLENIDKIKFHIIERENMFPIQNFINDYPIFDR